MNKATFTVKKIFLYGLGCILFGLVGFATSAPVYSIAPHPNWAYIVLTVFAYLYGPVAGAMIGAFGTFLSDQMVFGVISDLGWLISSTFIGLLIGLTFSYTRRINKRIVALLAQIILILVINAILLIGIKPFISSAWVGLPYVAILHSSVSTFWVNSFVVIVFGIPIGKFLEKKFSKK